MVRARAGSRIAAALRSASRRRSIGRAEHDPVDLGVRVALDQGPYRTGAADLDVVAVRAQAKHAERTVIRPAPAPADHPDALPNTRWVTVSSSSPSPSGAVGRRAHWRARAVTVPDRPGRTPLSEQVLELLALLERVHADPVAVVPVGHQLAARDQTLEGFVDQILARLQDVEDRLPQDEEAAVDPEARRARQLNVLDAVVSADRDDVERLAGTHRQKGRDLAATDRVLDQLGQGEVGQHVGVVGKEQVLAFQVPAHGGQALADVGVAAGLGEGDPPAVDVALEQLDARPTLGIDEVVGQPFLVVHEIPPDHVALVTEAKDEVPVAVVRIVAHEVPKDRPVAERDHGFGHRGRELAHAHALAAAEQHDFHRGPLRPRRRGILSTASPRGSE